MISEFNELPRKKVKQKFQPNELTNQISNSSSGRVNQRGITKALLRRLIRW